MMIVLFDKPEFEYDVHSLVKAFYPEEDVEMYYTCPESDVEGRNVACMHHGADGKLEEMLKGASRILEISYGEKETAIRYTNPVTETEIKTQFDISGLDRIAVKNSLKQKLYAMLRTDTGKELPWGSLTGIRPTKIPMKMLEDGCTEEEIFSYMREVYAATEQKARLAIEIAKRERSLLQRIDYENGYSLYIGIPFCPSTCLYCSFTSYPISAWKNKVDAYLDALEREIEFTASLCSGKKLDSIYIGGGTPTTLEPAQLERLIKKIKSCFDISKCLEFTVEAGRPDSITEEKLDALRENGISRISINPQTMKQETLDLIGRHHTVEQTIESFRLARRLGFDNINMDLIIGLPGEELSDVRHTMEVIRELRPDNVTVHSLAVKRAARLTIFKDQYQDMQMKNTQEHMDLCAEYCRDIELFPYYLYRQKGMAGNMENVGYAKEGKAGLYNILIMEEVQTIVALGAGSVSKRVYPDGTIKRCENVKDVGQYIGRIEEMLERKRRLANG